MGNHGESEDAAKQKQQKAKSESQDQNGPDLTLERGSRGGASLLEPSCRFMHSIPAQLTIAEPTVTATVLVHPCFKSIYAQHCRAKSSGRSYETIHTTRASMPGPVLDHMLPEPVSAEKRSLARFFQQHGESARSKGGKWRGFRLTVFPAAPANLPAFSNDFVWRRFSHLRVGN